VEPGDERVIVTLGGEMIAESRRSWPFLGSGRAPVYYAPSDRVTPGYPGERDARGAAW
jgi:uncharacterized protein (DUF427 family)